MKVSVIIVNYNVEHFLEQCLNSVCTALERVAGDIWVVDNNSIDGSVAMVESKFPHVNLIANKENLGFSKANNQAMERCNGEYVLLLNPDTIIEEDTLEKVVQFMDEHPDAGGLGVKMLDGKGNFLPESKRGLPTPSVAFYKIFGLSRIFPKSKKFGQYHLGYLDKDETHAVDILSGAFMLMRKVTLDKVGLLDEAFFMYGEDIDLSYRIVKGGYKNYYYPGTQIIHYKGESTKKSSVNYVFVFYNAMIIFARKHFSQKNARLFSFLINLAIYFRASVAILNRLVKRSFSALLDLMLVGGALTGIAYGYQEFTDISFPEEVLWWAIPGYSVLWTLFIYLFGGYDKPVRVLNLFKGIAAGTIVILTVYALLDKSYQFSRVFILLGALAVIMVTLFNRLIQHALKLDGANLFGNYNKRFAIVGRADEVARVEALLQQTNNQIEMVGYVLPEDQSLSDKPVLGKWNQVDQIIHIHGIDEVIFCAKDLPAGRIISMMSKLDTPRLDFKIAQPESLYLIGSNSIDTSGDLYALDINSISKTKNRRNKRLLDLTLGIVLLATFPLTILMVRKKGGYVANLTRVVLGKRTFVGFAAVAHSANIALPKLRAGMIDTGSLYPAEKLTVELADKLNVIYAKDYRVSTDVNLIFKCFRKLGG